MAYRNVAPLRSALGLHGAMLVLAAAVGQAALVAFGVNIGGLARNLEARKAQLPEGGAHKHKA
jgi:hypothetical protein